MTRSTHPLLRLDTATVLRRFWHLERALTLTFGAWVPAVGRLDSKAALAKGAWQSSLAADELRERVFELRYPDRAIERGDDHLLIELFEAAVHAPDAEAVLQALAEIFVPALRDAYETYLQASDEIADGPTFRFLRTALEDKTEQATALRSAAAHETATDAGDAWLSSVRGALQSLGGVSLHPPGGDGLNVARTEFEVPDRPARDDRYFSCSFYWPDNFDPAFGYGEGPKLQLRTAVSHINEVWAVDTAGAILYGLGPQLSWEFIVDAARWLYDESRHMTMGELRLLEWGFERKEIPLGSYIYEASAGKDVVHRLGMLAYFETKNIGKKAQRAETFGSLGDRSSQRDMEFDWADEAIHAGYGRKWLRVVLERNGDDPDTWRDVVADCERDVVARVQRATEEEKAALRRQADVLIEKAERVLGPHTRGEP